LMHNGVHALHCALEAGMADSQAYKRPQQSGFTMVELIVTMMIIGILAVAVVPRFTENSAFETRSFNDEVMAALRYAHKTAIASRRDVCVTFGTSTVSFSIASAAGNGATCNVNLAGPTGKTPFIVSAKPGISFVSQPANFRFDALGRTNAPTQTFQVADLPTMITVEQESGYVHP
ncbi:MAG: pilus assembly FimT family protein, partial [Burkholderiaceae bacterium]